MSRGTGTKKLLDEKTVGKALRGDKATLDELARKGGNKGSSKADTNAPQAADAAKKQAEAEAAELKRVLETPVPNEARLAKELGVSVEVIRKMHSQVENLKPDSDVAMNARGIKPAVAKAINEGRKDNTAKEKPETEEKPWYMKSGPGFWNLLRERGRGSTNEIFSQGGGSGEQGGGPSLEDLIKKKVVITGKPPVPPVPAAGAPSAPTGGR